MQQESNSKQPVATTELSLTIVQALAIIDDAVVAINSDLEIFYYNRGAQQAFGYSPDEIIGKPLASLLPIGSAARHRRHIDAFAHGSIDTKYMGERRSVRGRRKDGSEFPAEVSMAKIKNGNDMLFLAIVRDLTKRASLEVVISAMAETSHELISIIDHDLHFSYVNPSFISCFGYERAELLNSFDISKLVHPDDLERLRVIAQSESGDSVVYRVLTKKGEWLWLEGERYTVRDGNTLQIVAIDRDINERIIAQQSAEAELKRSKATTDLLTETLDHALDVNWERKSYRD